MTVSCPTWGWEWGTDDMASAMEELASLGVNWIAIHPYARIGNDGSVQWRPVDPTDPPPWLSRPIAEAKRLGQSIFLKPHLAYWGSRFAWRGDIEFGDPEARARFWTGYEAWITNLASACRGVGAFCVGTELDRMLDQEGAWRSTISAVRRRLDAPLTYAANWDAFAQCPFWDALDAVGVQAYFPVATEPGPPDEDALRQAWIDIEALVGAVSRATGKPVVFTELGYNLSARAAVEPWAFEQGGADAAEVQIRCLDAALAAVEASDVIRGAFLWKWFPGGRVPRDFAMADEGPRAVIRSRWGPT